MYYGLIFLAWRVHASGLSMHSKFFDRYRTLLVMRSKEKRFSTGAEANGHAANLAAQPPAI